MKAQADGWICGKVMNPTTGRRRLSVTVSFLRDSELDQMRDAIEDEAERRREDERQKREAEARRTVMHRRVVQELVRCGAIGCQCKRGKLHGPYWYAYLAMGDGRTRKRYIGRAANAAAALKKAAQLT